MFCMHCGYTARETEGGWVHVDSKGEVVEQDHRPCPYQVNPANWGSDPAKWG